MRAAPAQARARTKAVFPRTDGKALSAQPGSASHAYAPDAKPYFPEQTIPADESDRPCNRDFHPIRLLRTQKFSLRFDRVCAINKRHLAGVMELADVTDSKSVGLITRVGSSPTTGTISSGDN